MSKEGKQRRALRSSKCKNAGRSGHQAMWADLLKRSLTWVVNERIFEQLARHGNTSWLASQLVVLAVLWVWSDQSTLTGAFGEAKQVSLTMFGQVALNSYQGLTGALVTWTGRLLPLLWSRLHALMEQAGKEHWRIGRWLALAVDGSRATTPRTRSNEVAFSAPNYGGSRKAKSRKKWRNKKRRSKRLSEPVKPQIWLTLIWHMGLKMPWCWKTGPSTSSERHHFMDLLKSLVFPKNTLFCCDAGFVGYDLWKTILDHGQHLLIRVGGNVHLLRGLGSTRRCQDLVFLWPNEVARRQEPPIVLRLLEFQGHRGKVYLVTSVLNEAELTLRQAMQMYRLRWGIELQFRSFKQTFGRSKLRSRTPDHALVELDWSLVGLWLVQLFAVKEQIRIDSPPRQSSVALALAVIHDSMRWSRYVVSDPRALARRLAAAVKDSYQRRGSKRARYQPNYKDKPSATQPRLVAATAAQKKAYQSLTTAL
jgi:Transposase DDE domain